MRLLPEGIDEMSANFRWGVEWRLRMIEDVVCAPRGLRDRRTRHGGVDGARPPGRAAGG